MGMAKVYPSTQKEIRDLSVKAILVLETLGLRWESHINRKIRKIFAILLLKIRQCRSKVFNTRIKLFSKL